MEGKKEKTTPLLALLKELIVEKGFDPALMDEPFLIDQINTFDKDKRGYSKDEANNILNMIWYNGIDSGRIVFAKYNRHKHESSLEKQPFDKPTEYNTIDNIINSTVKRNHLQSKHFWKQDCLVSKKNPLKMSNNSFILLSLAILFSIWMGCIYLVSTYGNQDAIRYGCLGGGGIFTGILIAIAQKWK